MNAPRILYFISGLTLVILGFLIKILYRPYAYLNELSDWGFANSSPSLFYVVGFSLLLLINPKFKILYTTAAVTLASIAFEIYQYFGTNKIDIFDIVYSFFGAVLAIITCNRLKKTLHNKVYM